MEYIEVDGVLIEKDDIEDTFKDMEYIPIDVLMETPSLILKHPEKCNWSQFSDLIIEFFPQFVNVDYFNWKMHSELMLEHRFDLFLTNIDKFNWYDQSSIVAEKCSDDLIEKYIEYYNFEDFSYSLQKYQPELAEKYKDRLCELPDNI